MPEFEDLKLGSVKSFFTHSPVRALPHVVVSPQAAVRRSSLVVLLGRVRGEREKGEGEKMKERDKDRVWERGRERQRQKERQRDRGRGRERESVRETERERDRQKERQRETERERERVPFLQSILITTLLAGRRT